MKKDSTAYSADRPVWDTRDCSVRALACATGVSYQVASMTFSAKGRQVRKATDVALSNDLYGNVLGMRRIELAEGLRLAAFLEVAKTGRYLVHKKGHAFAVIDGVVHDWEGTRSSRDETLLTRVWKVTEKATEKMAAMERIVKELGL